MKSKLFLFSVLLLAAGSIASAQNVTSAMRSKTDPLKAGEIAPDFTLNDQSGKAIQLSSVKSPTVLVFYRGYWCPFCARQLADLRTLLKPNEKVSLLAVSVDPAEKSLGLMKKIASDGKGEVAFPLLSDPGHKTIDAYGLFDTAYLGQDFEGIPRATVLVLNKDRKVTWASISTDYKRRPTVADIRSEIDKVSGM